MTFTDPRTVDRHIDGHHLPRTCFARGCFQHDLDARVVLGIDHACSSHPDGSARESIDESLIIADTARGTLRLAEDGAGLVFTAYIRPDACVSYGDEPLVNICEAIARGDVGVSVAPLGRGATLRSVGAAIPPDVLMYRRVVLAEISLVLPPLLPGSPGTWVAAATPDAIDRLRRECEDIRCPG